MNTPKAPPRRIALPPKTVDAAAGSDSTPDSTPAPPPQPPKQMVAPKKAPPAKKLVAPTPPAKKSEKVTTKKLAKPARGPRAATENVVPKVAAIKGGKWGDEAIELASLIHGVKNTDPAKVKGRSHNMEVRNVPDRMQVYFNEKAGIPCQITYSKPEHIAKIFKVVKTIPAIFLPAKWVRALEG